nr:Inorganic diphosphatase [Ipomoea batatas]
MENRRRANNERDEVVVPVMNSTRANMWKQQQAAWLFHHVGLDIKALFFFDEVDLETLTESKQVIMQVLGEDILKTNGEVVSECTVLTDNYCEEAYDLLQTPMLKKLLLAGILLDTGNLMLSAANKVPMKTKDAEAVQLLMVGSAPDYKNTLFDQCMYISHAASILF